MRALQLAVASAIAITFLSCSGSSSGGAKAPPRALTQEENVRFKAAVLSFGQVTSLAQDYVKRPGHANALFNALADVVNSPSSPLKQTIDEGICTKTIHYPDEQPPLKSGDTSLPVFSIDINGEGCPVMYHADVHGSQLADGMTAVLNYKYQGFSAEAKKSNDVDMANLTGTIVAHVNQVQNGAKISFTMDFGGSGHSQKEGDFAMGDKIAMDMTFSGGDQPTQGQGMPGFGLNGQVNETSTFTFHDMAAEMTASVSMLGQDQKEVYTINGQTVSAQEYKDLHDSMQIPGMQQTGDDQQQKMPNSAVLSCTSRTYPGTVLPADLQKDLGQGHLPATMWLTEFHSCSLTRGIQSGSANVGMGTVTTSFDFTNEGFAKSEVKYCEGTAPCVVSQNYFMPNETKGFAEALGSYSVVTFCESKPSCF